jgi:hypothetical protein
MVSIKAQGSALQFTRIEQMKDADGKPSTKLKGDKE